MHSTKSNAGVKHFIIKIYFAHFKVKHQNMDKPYTMFDLMLKDRKKDSNLITNR